MVKNVTGTGLLLALHIKENIPVVGRDGLEQECRKRGLGVIHGGKNALRFTPWFRITPREVTLVVETLRGVLTRWVSPDTAPVSHAIPTSAGTTQVGAKVNTAATHSGGAKSIPAALKVIVENYLSKTPSAVAAMRCIAGHTETDSLGYNSIPIDHLAFRTFAVPGRMCGIDSAASFWEGLGYRRSEETLHFPDKCLRSKWLSPPIELLQIPGGCPAPRVFISEVIVDELPRAAQLIIKKYVNAEHITADRAKEAMLTDGGNSHEASTWPQVSLDDYLSLRSINPVAAWTLLHGYSLNHMAVAGHWLEDPQLEGLNDKYGSRKKEFWCFLQSLLV